MKEITQDKELVARCGLYCGACRSYLKDRCPGCAKNEKASWCQVRSCCLENQYASCADCRIMPLEQCKKYNNFIAKAIGFILRSDRKACIESIKASGYENFVRDMAEKKRMTIRR